MANSAVQFDTLGPNAILLKGGSGTLFGYDIGNSDGSPAMVPFYDKATAPIYGVDTPLLRVLVPPGLNAFRTWAGGNRVHGRANCSSEDIARDTAAQYQRPRRTFVGQGSLMVKLRASDGVSSIVHDGVEVPVGDDRSVEVDELSAEVFKVHGFRPWNGGKNAVTIDAVPQSHMDLGLLQHLRRPVDVVPAPEGLQARLPAPDEGTLIPPDDTETGGEHEQDISSLSRRELFAFLRARGVPVSLPITNEELRAAARRAREG